jgi:hypothetical protein
VPETYSGSVQNFSHIGLLLADLVAFSHLQFSQIRGRQPYLNVRKNLYVIRIRPHFPECAGKVDTAGLISTRTLVT